MNKEKFKEVAYTEAIKLKEEKQGEFLKNIPFNNDNIFVASNIKTAEDALWWSFVTVTTVGYGDLYPVTTAGRIIAAALMTVGVALFGTFTAYVASWFVQQREEQEEEEERIEQEKLRSDKNKAVKKEEKAHIH